MQKNKNYSFLRFLSFIIIFIILWYLGRFFNIDPDVLSGQLDKFPIYYSAVIYIVLYVIITFFVFFSKDIFYILGAFLFGAYLSAFLIYLSELINACILFYFARFLGRAYIEKSLEKKYKHLDERLGSIGFFWIFLFRAMPLIPYRFLDLSAGLTKINFRKYILAAILGSPLKLFWIQYVLAGVGRGVFKDPYALVEYFTSNKNLLLFSIVYVIGVIMLIIKINNERRKT